MTALHPRKLAILAGAACCLLAAPASARGGGGHGGGGHSSGGGHFSGGGHVSTPHYSSPMGHVAPHYSAPMHGPIGGGVGGGGGGYGGSYGYGRGGYIGGGRGAYVAGGRVPAFYGGPHGRVWWGSHYGWRVPAYWGGYYRPYIGYWGVGYWVTDWIMLDYLAGEEARLRAYGPTAVPVEGPPLEMGVREELREQISDILAMPPPPTGNAATSGGTLVVSDPRVAGALAAPHHVFVVSKPVTVTGANGATCSLTPADLVRTSSPIPSGQSAASVSVAASKHGSCAPGSVVAVYVADLVHFEEALLERVTRGAAAAKATEAEAPPATTPATVDGEVPPSDGAVPPSPSPTPSTTTTPPLSGGMSL